MTDRKAKGYSCCINQVSAGKKEPIVCERVYVGVGVGVCARVLMQQHKILSKESAHAALEDNKF